MPTAKFYSQKFLVDALWSLKQMLSIVFRGYNITEVWAFSDVLKTGLYR